MTKLKPHPQEPLVQLANEYLAPHCKWFSMMGQISQGVLAVNREIITFRVHIGKPFNRKCGFETEAEQRDVVYDVRNVYLYNLGDLLPCPKFEAIYSDVVLGIHEKEFSGQFYDPSILDPLEPTCRLPLYGPPVPHVICAFSEEREKYRSIFRDAWERLEA